MGLVGIGVIVAGVFLVFLKIIPLAVISDAASIVSEAIRILFIARAVQSSRQADKKYMEVQENFKASHLISICETIELKSRRVETKILIVERLAGKGFGLKHCKCGKGS